MAADPLVVAEAVRDAAAEALATAEAALATLNLDIMATRAELARLDALSSVKPGQLAEIENLRRRLREATEPRTAALAAVDEARAALDAADRELAPLRLRSLDAKIERVEEQLRTEFQRRVEAVAREVVLPRLKERTSLVGAAQDLAEFCGARRWYGPAEGYTLALADQCRSIIDAAVEKLMPPMLPVPPARDPIGEVALRNFLANTQREQAERERSTPSMPTPVTAPEPLEECSVGKVLVED